MFGRARSVIGLLNNYIPSCFSSPNHVIESLNMARSIMVAVYESINIGICMIYTAHKKKWEQIYIDTHDFTTAVAWLYSHTYIIIIWHMLQISKNVQLVHISYIHTLRGQKQYFAHLKTNMLKTEPTIIFYKINN